MSGSHVSGSYIIEQQKILRSYFQDLYDVVAESEQPIDFDTMLKKLELTTQDIELESNKLTFDLYFRLLGAVDATGKIPGFGLQLGTRKTVQCYGIYGYALLSSSTYAQFSLVAKRIFRAIYDVLEMTADVKKGQLIFTYETLLTPRFGFIPLMEHTLACGVSLMKSLMPSNVSWDNCEIHFTYPRPAYVDMYPTYLPCEIKFNQPVTQLRVPEHWLTIKLAAGDKYMAQICESQFKKILDGFSSSASLADRIRRILLNGRSNNLPKITALAEQFHTTERTLRQQLAKENTSFREITLDIKMTQAKRYLLETELSIQEVSYLLGYAQIQNFYRTFGKIVGTTPEAFRRKSFIT